MADRILEYVYRSNQRGGRMFSVIDLIRAGTLTVPQAAYLLRRIEEGASWVVGAVPGGAGKTTIMSAFLAMLPQTSGVRLAVSGSGWESASSGECVVAYEISPGHYDAYVWGEAVARLLSLAHAGVRIVTNLHANTLEEARDQIVYQCGASAEHFAAMDLFLPIEISGTLSRKRVIRTMRDCRNGEWDRISTPPEPTGRDRQIAVFLEDCDARECCAVEDVRSEWMAFLHEPSER